MKRTVIARLIVLVPTLIIVSIAVFSLRVLIPGGPAEAILGTNANPAAIKVLNRQLGLNRPVVSQYLSWVKGVLHWDFGGSYFSRQPVTTVIAQRLSPTLELVIGALLVALIVGGALGIWAAIHYQDPAGKIVLGATGLGVSVPDFWLATIASGVFGLSLKWVPAVGYAPLSQGIGANLKSIIVPILVLSLASGALFARHLQSSMVAALRSPYVRTAWAMGMKPRQVYWTYGIRNSLGPTITFLPLVVASLVGASVIVEIVFAINGLSSEIVQSITNRDYSVLQAVVLLLALTVVVLNFLADLALAFIDPRTRRTAGR
jgi:peptide/nickel transport system permease protein